MDAVAPLFLVLAVALILPPWSPDARARAAVIATGFGALLAQYLWWRLTETVLPAEPWRLSTAFVWTMFVAELWLWFETLQLALVLLRRTDRSAEADAHEARLRSLKPDDLPAVDVMIATYDEPLDVLERSIAGALALDWPRNRLRLHVLDDGRREWLAEYCRLRGINHMTRDDNTHAKAGNLNAAFKRTTAPFILVLDADFVPQRRMLMRTMGFFDDPGIGIVQTPHYFFNSTPLQNNLNMRATLPDEQRFFFDMIQPGRDGWDCAFCCGSNGIIRRAALEAIGGEMPTESITEDMLLTMTMLRKGYVTRFLAERLAIGLAPETLDAYFVQRGRWAQGGIQLLFAPGGPLGPGLSLVQRLLFSPSHWLSQSLCQPLIMAAPAIFLLTGAAPLVNTTFEDVIRYQVTTIVAAFAFLGYLAPRDFAPVASTVESVLQSFRLLPLVLITLVKPHGHSFKVTPKGSAAGLSREDRFTIKVALGLILATGTGLIMNASFQIRIVAANELLPVVAFWSIFNMFILLIVMTMAVPRPCVRSDERFDIDEFCRIRLPDRTVGGDIVNLSLSGILFVPDVDCCHLDIGDWIGIDVGGVGLIPVEVRRITDVSGHRAIGARLHLPPGRRRDALIQKLYTTFSRNPPPPTRGTSVPTMLKRILEAPPRRQLDVTEPRSENASTPPLWLSRQVGDTGYPARFDLSA